MIARRVFVLVGILVPVPLPAMAADMPGFDQKLTDAQVVAFAQLALDGIDTEYPNKPSEVLVGPESLRSPREMHPAFFGCFDWHSAVHGHWMLVRLLKLYPECSVAAPIRQSLDTHLTAENLRAEADYFMAQHNQSFERMYGWAWALRLAAELKSWDDPQAQEWSANLQPLEQILVQRVLGYLPRLTWPIRTGVHPDSAFALAQLLDYAREVEHQELTQLIVARSRDFYLQDRDYAVRYEPSGEDFFSPGLNEVDLMRRVLTAPQFSDWLDSFFPTLRDGQLGNLLQPATVSDITDGKLVHLAGLNLSRAWTLRGVAGALATDDPRVTVLRSAAKAHLQSGLSYVASGHYEGDHWLATFAVYALSNVGADVQSDRP